MSTDLFIRRPVMTTLLMAGILVFGIMAYRLLGDRRGAAGGASALAVRVVIA